MLEAPCRWCQRGVGPQAVDAWARLLSLAALGQWVSYYVAMLQGTDPWPVPMLTEVKRRLATPSGAAAPYERATPCQSDPVRSSVRRRFAWRGMSICSRRNR